MTPSPRLIAHLRDAAFADRARRIAHYVGGTDVAAHTATLKELAQRLLRPDPNDSPVRWAEYRARVERARFAAVFTAHPTFALPADVAPRARGNRKWSPDTCRRVASTATDHARGGIRASRRSHSARPRRNRQVQRRAADRRTWCLARSLDGAQPPPRHPLDLGRLRHRRSHRYRLVGHAAPAAGDEAPPACTPARAGQCRAINRAAHRAHQRRTGCRRASA